MERLRAQSAARTGPRRVAGAVTVGSVAAPTFLGSPPSVASPVPLPLAAPSSPHGPRHACRTVARLAPDAAERVRPPHAGCRSPPFPLWECDVEGAAGGVGGDALSSPCGGRRSTPPPPTPQTMPMLMPGAAARRVSFRPLAARHHGCRRLGRGGRLGSLTEPGVAGGGGWTLGEEAEGGGARADALDTVIVSPSIAGGDSGVIDSCAAHWLFRTRSSSF